MVLEYSSYLQAAVSQVEFLLERPYFILSAHRPVTFVGVFDAPLELTDEAIVKRLEDFYECQVVNTYHNCH